MDDTIKMCLVAWETAGCILVQVVPKWAGAVLNMHHINTSYQIATMILILENYLQVKPISRVIEFYEIRMC